MSSQTFLVRLTPDRNWLKGQPSWKQPYWEEHARFIDGLQAEGLLYMAGPLANFSAVYLVVQSNDRKALLGRLRQDPWVIQSILAIDSLEEWLVLMDPRVNYESKVPG